MPEPKQRLGMTLDHLQRRWSTPILVQPGSGAGLPGVAALPTGFAALDRALGIGGVPRGHLTFLQGKPTSGAGTLALKAAANASQAGEYVAYLDLAGTFDPDYAARCGVSLERVVVVQPISFPLAVEALTILVKAAGVAIFDPAPETVSSVPDAAALRRLISVLHHTACALIILGRGATDGLAEHAALRLELTRQRWLMRRQDVRGYRVSVHITRNRFAPPGGRVTLTLGFSGAVKGDGT